MKFIISEGQYKKVIKEQIGIGLLKKTINFLLRSKKTANQISNYILNIIPASWIKRVRLVFPSHGWEKIFLQIFESLGVITGYFETLDDAIEYNNKLVEKGVKPKEFVIGSHGNFGTLLVTKMKVVRASGTKHEKEFLSDSNFQFNNSFLESLKPIIQKDTIVFFTACLGADYLDTLKDAAEKLGVGVYGSAGIYNPISNTSEEGFYWCSPEKFNQPTEKKLKPYEITDRSLEVNVVTKKEVYNFNYFITIKDGVFDIKIPTFITDKKNYIMNHSYRTSYMRDDMIVTNFSLYVLHDIENHLSNFYDWYGKSPTPKKESWLNNTLVRKEKELGGEEFNDDRLRKYINQKIESGDIKIEINVNGKIVNIKSLPVVNIQGSIDNEFLLQNNLCKKISQSPISWFNHTLL